MNVLIPFNVWKPTMFTDTDTFIHCFRYINGIITPKTIMEANFCVVHSAHVKTLYFIVFVT